jgi:hypothetical protein
MNWDGVLESNILAGIGVSISPDDMVFIDTYLRPSDTVHPLCKIRKKENESGVYAERRHVRAYVGYADRNSASEDAMQRLQNPAVSSPRI